MSFVRVQYSSKQYRGLQAGEYPCGPVVANYLWACNGILWPIVYLWSAETGEQ